MDPFERKEIGTTGIEITRIGLGARGIVDPNVTVSDSQAKATVETALEIGVNYIDTSPRYGLGRSELLVGQSALPDNRDEYVVSTKVGRLLDPGSDDGWVWDFSGDGVRRSLESSLDRLGLDRVDMLFIHSPTNHHEAAITEAYPALAELRSEGVVGAIGVGMTEWAALQFILAHPAVTSVIPGSSFPAHVRENVEMAQLKVPSSLWEDLRDDRLIQPGAPVPS
jgi:D-threo-aldose 1-dehydrogenase